MSSGDTPEKHHRWRVLAGEPGRRHHRKWPVSYLGAGLTEIPRDDAATADGPREGDLATRVLVVAESVDWLRHVLDDPISLALVRKLTVVVLDWTGPTRSWCGRLGPLLHVVSHQVRMPGAEGQVEISVEVRWSKTLRELIAAILPLLTPTLPLPAPASADRTAQEVFPSWLDAGHNATVVVGELPGNEDIRPHDLVLTGSGLPQPPQNPDLPGEVPATGGTPAGYGTVLAVSSTGAGVGGRPDVVLVNPEQTELWGRYGPFGPTGGTAELTFTGAGDGHGWQLTGPDGASLGGGRLDRPRTGAMVAKALTGTGTVICRTMPARHPVEEAALLVQLMSAGILVHVPDLPPACAAALSDEVRALVVRPLPEPHADVFDWELRTVAQRRAALRQHAVSFALPRLAATTFPGLVDPPSVSAVLVTKRLDYVRDAVAAIEAQTYPNLEIVLCLHGVELPAGLRAELAGCRRPIETLVLAPGYGFGEAIGAATARSRGTLVTKFDDDDTYGPEHVWDLVLARQYSGATMVGKAAEFTYLQTLDTTVRRAAGDPESFARVVAGGTMLISKGDLEAVGGWRPVPRSIDRGLIDRVWYSGGLIYRTHPLGYIYQRRSDGHTWDPGLEYFLRDGGTQWSGFPRYHEFGTVPAVEDVTDGFDVPAGRRS
ncbi:glycosyltransferase family 2 protein [Micromonospora zhanjiangensis]